MSPTHVWLDLEEDFVAKLSTAAVGFVCRVEGRDIRRLLARAARNVWQKSQSASSLSNSGCCFSTIELESSKDGYMLTVSAFRTGLNEIFSHLVMINRGD